MPVTLEILGGSVGNQFPAPVGVVYTYTRKRTKNSVSPSAKDTMSWRWDGSDVPELVFRSPVDRDQWVTSDERAIVISIALEEGWAFRRPKGCAMVRPCKDAVGWLKTLVSNGRRRQHRHTGQSWELIFRELDNGW